MTAPTPTPPLPTPPAAGPAPHRTGPEPSAPGPAWAGAAWARTAPRTGLGALARWRSRELPRDTRDTWFLLAVIGWTIAPHAANLPWWCSALAALLLAWRGVIAARQTALPSRWWLLALLLLSMAATLASHRTLLGRDAGVSFIVLLLALKTLEMRARRDAFVIFFLGFFTLLSNFFFSQSLPVAAAMLVSLLGLLTALVNAHLPVGRPPLWQSARTAGFLALLGAPVMAVLFVLFPRIAPLWGVPTDALTGRSGLSASMQVGNIATLALDGTVALRVRFQGAAPPQDQLYFRGPVLSQFDGREWRALAQDRYSSAESAGLRVQGPAYPYQLTLQAHQRPWLLALDATPAPPVAAGRTVRMGADLQWGVERGVFDLLRYDAVAYPQFQHGPTVRDARLRPYLQWPLGFNPRTVALGQELRAQAGGARADTRAIVQLALQRLRTGGYQYTLSPGVYGIHTADEFWFDRKQGFCEHIASSFVLLMRAAGVPARIVTGYQGGEANSLDGFLTVRQSDAHAWAEVWTEGLGWERVDPTSAVAPARIGAYQPLQAPAGAVAQAVRTVSPELAARLRALWDAANNRWNQWVLTYGQSQQLDLLRSLGVQTPGWEDLVYALIAVVVAAASAGALWTLWERQRQDPWLRLLRQARERLRRAGLELPPQAAPRTLATLVQAHSGWEAAQRQAWSDWLLCLESWRYAGAPGTPQGLRRLRRALRTLPAFK
ncbi:MAG: transglutaminase family protein [Rhodoferax sp.]